LPKVLKDRNEDVMLGLTLGLFRRIITRVGSDMKKVWLVLTHRDTGETDSFEIELYSWEELIKDHLLCPTFNWQWIITIEDD
jgi:hypothetical protein